MLLYKKLLLITFGTSLVGTIRMVLVLRVKSGKDVYSYRAERFVCLLLSMA